MVSPNVLNIPQCTEHTSYRVVTSLSEKKKLLRKLNVSHTASAYSAILTEVPEKYIFHIWSFRAISETLGPLLMMTVAQ